MFHFDGDSILKRNFPQRPIRHGPGVAGPRGTTKDLNSREGEEEREREREKEREMSRRRWFRDARDEEADAKKKQLAVGIKSAAVM